MFQKYFRTKAPNYWPCRPVSFRLGLVLFIPTPTSCIHATNNEKTHINVRLLVLCRPYRELLLTIGGAWHFDLVFLI
jgi:hypothetical protein